MSPEPPAFHRLVYRFVRRVPHGKVVTYGQLAALIGHPRAARAVGMALGALQEPWIDDIPWQRVVSADGRCSHRDRFWSDIQRATLDIVRRAYGRVLSAKEIADEVSTWKGHQR